MTGLKVGKELAAYVAKKLLDGHALAYSHPDYCGTGLYFRKGSFYYARFFDGMPARSLHEEKGRVAFEEWLAEQDDHTFDAYDENDLFYRGNQRVTVDRLREFVARDGTGHLCTKH